MPMTQIAKFGVPVPIELEAFLNPVATNSPESRGRLEAVRHFLMHPTHRFSTITDIASPEHIAEIQSSGLVYIGGGDGTVRRVIGATLGVVPDDFAATQRNEETHRERASKVIVFAGKDGNACNFAVSAHGPYAANPGRLPYAKSIHIGYHRPLMREIVGSDGYVLSNDLATSGLGLGSAAVASEKLQEAKPELNKLKPAQRLLSEASIALQALLSAQPFSVNLTFVRSNGSKNLRLNNIVGLEFMGTDPYAKQVRNKVHVDDTLWQPAVQRRKPGKVADALNFAETLARLRLGQHLLDPLDLDGMSIEIRLLSGKPVQFHEDGETSPDTVLEPGQVMRLHLSRIAVPVLMIR
jgi:hypothetical protein